LKPVNTRNVAASVRQRLLNIAHGAGDDFGLVLTRYALERLLYRLSRSKYRDQFILKGAMLFQVWAQQPHRPTRDLDLLGRGDSSLEHCQAVFRELCHIPVEDDDLIFSAETVNAEKIKEEQDYEGARVKFIALLENARIAIQVDVGFGDAVTSDLIDHLTLLPMPTPRIQAYPMDIVVEKLARSFPFEARSLGALHATFERRRTPLDPDGLKILLADLSGDASKRTQWRAILRKSSLTAPDEFTLINSAIQEFLLSPAGGTAESRISSSWPPGGPWHRPDRPGSQSEQA
jgi:hypothetical protein